jgi:16S rRNA (guanine1516-N2)-methyltransferase
MQLVQTPTHLELRAEEFPHFKPLVIDFLHGSFAYRLQHGKSQKQLIAKAVGLKRDGHLFVLDATAGLGRDGFLLATLGCKVLMLERSPIIEALLQDGLERALADARYADLDIQLINVDAINFLEQLVEKPDVIYLDPMFPERSKSASVKKELQILQALLGEDKSADKLLEKALAVAKKRVVVKRPRLAPNLSDLKPQFSIVGKEIRFDVYQC